MMMGALALTVNYVVSRVHHIILSIILCDAQVKPTVCNCTKRCFHSLHFLSYSVIFSLGKQSSAMMATAARAQIFSSNVREAAAFLKFGGC
jgi:hypothetical protein